MVRNIPIRHPVTGDFGNLGCLQNSKLGCACGEGRCNPGRCDHVMMFDNDNAEACDKSGVAIRGRFPYDEQGRIILEVGHELPTHSCALFVSCVVLNNFVIPMCHQM